MLTYGELPGILRRLSLLCGLISRIRPTSARPRRQPGAAGFETWLVNAKDVRHLPGRPKTGKLDAVWLCKVAERQMLRPSFVPPPQIRQLRDLTRYRADLVAARTAEKQRAEKLLEDACIKLSRSSPIFSGCQGGT